MSKCFNCVNSAVYKVLNLGSKDQLFCAQHLPKFINLTKQLGVTVYELNKAAEETKPKKVKKETPAPEPVAEIIAPVVEETPEETLTEEV